MKKLKPIYLFTGPDHREIKKKVHEFELTLFPETKGEDINNISFFAEEAETVEIFSECQTFPVFTDKKLVRIHDAEKLETKALLEYLKQPVESTLLILTSSKNESDWNKDIVKLIREKGKIESFGEKYDNEALQYLSQKLKMANIPFEQEFIIHIIEQVENTTGALDIVVDAVEHYYQGKDPLRVRDIPDILTSTKTPNSFQFIDALFTKDNTKALRLLHHIMLEDFNPGSLISLIHRQLRLLFQCKIYIHNGASQDVLVRELKLAPFLIKKLNHQAKLFQFIEIETMIERLSLLDFKSKSDDAALLKHNFELFILGL